MTRKIFSLIRSSSSSSVGEDLGAAATKDGAAVDAGGAGGPADEDVAAVVADLAGVGAVLEEVPGKSPRFEAARCCFSRAE